MIAKLKAIAKSGKSEEFDDIVLDIDAALRRAEWDGSMNSSRKDYHPLRFFQSSQRSRRAFQRISALRIGFSRSSANLVLRHDQNALRDQLFHSVLLAQSVSLLSISHLWHRMVIGDDPQIGHSNE